MNSGYNEDIAAVAEDYESRITFFDQTKRKGCDEYYMQSKFVYHVLLESGAFSPVFEPNKKSFVNGAEYEARACLHWPATTWAWADSNTRILHWKTIPDLQWQRGDIVGGVFKGGIQKIWIMGIAIDSKKAVGVERGSSMVTTFNKTDLASNLFVRRYLPLEDDSVEETEEY